MKTLRITVLLILGAALAFGQTVLNSTALEQVVSDHMSTVTWMTDCVGCARLMDENYTRYVEVEVLDHMLHEANERAAENQARAERLAGYVQHKPRCPAGPPWAFTQHSVYGAGAGTEAASPVGPCQCGLSAALGLDGEGKHANHP